MIPLTKALSSSVGKKFVMALTGLAFALFLVTHLAGNLQLYLQDPVPFNKYAFMLASYGPLLWVAEIGLLLMIVAHIVTAIGLKMNHKAARGPQGYRTWKSKGGQSLANPASRSMILTGLVLGTFLVVHVLHFKFGKSIPEGYVMDYQGHPIRDLHRLVVETFQNPLWAFGYAGVMVLLGVHLRHGVWSGLQSLGLMNGQLTRPIYCVSFVIGALLAAGFLGIPLFIYFGGLSHG